MQTQLSSRERQHQRALGELEARHTALQSSVGDIQQELGTKGTALQTTQLRLSQRDAAVSSLENEILRLKAQTGDADTLGVIKRELSEQVAHIKTLEATNRQQMVELKQLRKNHKSVEVVEEEKRVLQSRVRMMDDLRKELAEAQLQTQILEDEKRSWTSYLEGESAGNEGMVYNSPEEMAKAFISERMEKLTLVERLGAMQPEINMRDESIRQLESEKAKLTAKLQKTKTGGDGTADGADSKARARLERQKNLAIKEVDYLRAQIKAFESEETEFAPEKVDEAANSRVQELESLIDQYRAEVQTLQTDLTKLEMTSNPAPPASLKRPLEDDADERLGELRRKTRSLQDELTAIQTRNNSLEADLKATTSQLTALRSDSSRTRVLELRTNPTATHAAIAASTLSTLRDENAALLAQLENRPIPTKVVPISTLESHRLQISDLEAQIARLTKKEQRLKQIWTSKFHEFAEAVAATLGWKVHFLPNGRFKVTSILYPSLVNKDGEEEENSILFDGEQGTMKVSGGRESQFANEIRPLIEFWVDGRKEVPAFLAACQLEFYERSTSAQQGEVEV